MLAQYHFAVDDRTIAMDMRLPYLFTYEDGIYMAGPMLQSADWFNLYLNPVGFHFGIYFISRQILNCTKEKMLHTLSLG